MKQLYKTNVSYFISRNYYLWSQAAYRNIISYQIVIIMGFILIHPQLKFSTAFGLKLLVLQGRDLSI